MCCFSNIFFFLQNTFLCFSGKHGKKNACCVSVQRLGSSNRREREDKGKERNTKKKQKKERKKERKSNCD